MVRWADYAYWAAFAETYGCLLFWHFYRDGDYLPVLMPLPETNLPA